MYWPDLNNGWTVSRGARERVGGGYSLIPRLVVTVQPRHWQSSGVQSELVAAEKEDGRKIEDPAKRSQK